MRQYILTGLATEQRFDSIKPIYYLVFNDGELRLPVPEDTAATLVSLVYTNAYASKEEPDDDIEDDEDEEDSPEEREVPQL